MSKENFKRYFQFALIVLAAGAIYPVIYLKTNYQETILSVFNMTLPQLNIIYSVLGVVFMVGYFPSGLLSDKFSAKKLLTVSLLGTAIGGFWFAQTPAYGSVIAIFCIWGVFSVFTFWSAHMKLVKLLAKPEEEGRFFGILDGGRGVIEAVLASVAAAIFAAIVGAVSTANPEAKRAGLVAIIYMYSFILLIASILVGIFVEDDKKVGAEKIEKIKVKKEKFDFGSIASIFKNKFVFLLGGIIFMSYAVTWSVYYLGGFMESNIAVNAVKVSQIMVIVLWMRPIGGIVGGVLADKIGKTPVLASALSGAAICLVIISILPISTEKTVFYALVVLIGLFLYAIRGTYWSLLGDCKIESKSIGVAVGVTSVLGYLPDILLPFLSSFLFARFGANGGYNAYFISTAVLGTIGVIFVVVFGKLVKKSNLIKS